MKRLVISLLVVGTLALAPAAFGQSTGTGYGGEAGGVAGQVNQGANPGGVAGTTASGANGPAASQASGGNRVLAFTGLDLALLAGGGLLLLCSGWAMSRTVGRDSAV